MYQPKLYLRFEPPIQNDTVGIGQLEKILTLIEEEYPTVTWWEGQSPTEYNAFTFDNEGDESDPNAEQIASLTIGHWPDKPNCLTYGQWGDNDMNYQNDIDGWQWLRERDVDIDKTSDIFNQLNESTHQPKLNLKFEEPIYDADELDKVLRVLGMVYPSLTWLGGDSIKSHNVIRDQEDGEENFHYDPIYYLTIGFFPHAPDKLTYTSAPDDDPSFADDEHHNYNSVDGWQWVKDNEINYDETTNIFNQLNESYDFLGQTNLKGFKFKKTLENNPKLWIIRTVINDDGNELYYKYEFSGKATEVLGSDLPQYGSITKEKVINHINNGNWEIVDMPTGDTEGIFNQIN